MEEEAIECSRGESFTGKVEKAQAVLERFCGAYCPIMLIADEAVEARRGSS